MKKLLIIILFFSNQLYSQNIGETYLLKLVKNDFEKTLKIYNNNFSFFINIKDSINLLKIKRYSFDTCDDYYYQYYELDVYINCLLYKPCIQKKCDTMRFSFLEVNGKIYKVFGFYHSDVLNLQYDYSKKAVDYFIKNLVKSDILTKKEARIYQRAILSQKMMIPKKVNHPSEFLRLFYDKYSKNSRTILLRPIPQCIVVN